MTKLVKAVYHPEIRTVEFTAGSGSRLLRSGGTLAWLFNNPGNLRPKKGSAYAGQIGVGDTRHGKLCIFSSVEAGRSEKRALLRRKYNSMTLRDAIYTYAPPADNNDSESYLAFVKKKTGLTDGVVLETLSDLQLDSMMAAMEQMEGFDARKETRKEQWVHVTSLILSDGARPISNQPVVIKRGDLAENASTDAFGRLPPLVTLEGGELIAVMARRGESALEKMTEIVLEARSQALVLVRSAEEHVGVLTSHNPRPASAPKRRRPTRYVVQPGDTLAKISKRFGVDVEKLLADNAGTIRNPDRIMAGQVISVYGKALPAAARGASAAAPPSSVQSLRSRAGQGHPLAIVAADLKRAPWMETAVAQLELWGGAHEQVIDDTINYHKETGLGFKSLSTAWCASFVNYCLKSAGYSHSGSAGSQSFKSSKFFHRISSPLYGALVVYSNPAKPGQGHVAFVYCKLRSGDLAVLGGNQGDSISFNSHEGVYIRSLKYKLEGFFVPIAYRDYAERQLAQGGDLGDDVYTLATLRAAFGKSTRVSRSDQNTR